MGSNQDNYGDTVTVSFPAIAVSRRDRIKKHGQYYTNLECGNCKEWWIMLSIGKKKKVYCPWCGVKCEVKNIKE